MSFAFEVAMVALSNGMVLAHEKQAVPLDDDQRQVRICNQLFFRFSYHSPF